MPPRALLVAYLFPPTGGNSPRMAFHYARALSRAGYEVDVVTPRTSPGHLLYRPDPSWAHSPPERVRVHHTYPGPLYRLVSSAASAGPDAAGAEAARRAHAARVRAWYRRLVRPWILPDGRADWYPWAVRRAWQLCDRRDPELLVTFGFPFTCHVIGLTLHRLRPRPWVAHNGDIWSFQPGNGLPAWRRAVDHRLELAMLRRAARLIVNTEATARAYALHFPEVPTDRFAVIPTGYEPSLYADASPEVGDRFRLVYTGAIAEGQRAGTALLEALALLRARGADDVECVVAGLVPRSFRDRARELQLDSALQLCGFLPAPAVARLQQGASVLVTFGMAGGLQVPCKLMEYLAARRPVLAIAPGKPDVAADEVLRTRRGLVVDERPVRIAAAIARLRRSWRRGTFESEFDLRSVPALSWDEVESRFLEAVEAARRTRHA